MNDFLSLETKQKIYETNEKVEKIERIEIPIIRRYIDFIMEELSEIKEKQSEDSNNITKILELQTEILNRLPKEKKVINI